MKVPENFTTRLGGNLYRNTPNLIVCKDEPILRVEREPKTGEVQVDLAIFDAKGREKALIEANSIARGDEDEFDVLMTEQSFTVREVETERTICSLQRCSDNKSMDVDVFVLMHAPDGFFIHANPAQSNLSKKPEGTTYSDLPAALVMAPNKKKKKKKRRK